MRALWRLPADSSVSRDLVCLRVEDGGLVWMEQELKNGPGGMVLVDGHVYGNSGPGMLVCLELATGKVKWQERPPVRAPPIVPGFVVPPG